MPEQYTTTISKRRQTSVPAALPLEPGQKLLWEAIDVEGPFLSLRIKVVPKNPVKAASGIFAGMGFGGVETLIRERQKDKKKEQQKQRMYSQKK